MSQHRPPRGIEVRHAAGCPARRGRKCNCVPSYRGRCTDPFTGKRIVGPRFPSVDQARNWRQDRLDRFRRGPSLAQAPTLDVAAEEFIEGAVDGSVRDRKGKVYKPSTIRGYRRALELRVKPALGRRRLDEITLSDVQQLVDRLLRQGLAGSTIHNTLDPLRRILARALHRYEGVQAHVLAGLEMPQRDNARDVALSPREAECLIQALPSAERALWATAFYAGLRSSELQALRWSDVEFSRDRIGVREGWD